METLLAVMIIVIGLVIFDALALTLGVDSRDLDPNDWSPRPQI